ncbi:hypothetical protein [Shewanella putrefaciens]|uniref:hypothetical protein n=1 Tax=Shewanella putrefaciens TaxID=24 RepID=UPI00242DAF87|nr:hypothetical protein [Shewanella putrefaciens]MCA1898330.1 hypothetical protein [Shewanella putrefaciens]
MKYPEYLYSATRHNYACRLLKDKLEAFDDSDRNSDNFKHIVNSLYYLSGYIIECSLKFKIFECSGYELEKDIDPEECNKYDINHRKKIMTHSFITLQNFLSSKISEVTCESEDKEISLLLSKWSPEVRYKSPPVNPQSVVDFYLHASKFLKEM